MPSKTFVLGAGFSAAAGFPLVRQLREQVISLIENERHPSWEPHLRPHLHGFAEGQFYAGLNAVDPSGSLGLEELMIALRERLESTHDLDPCYVTLRVLRDACGRLLWQKHRSLKDIPVIYRNFASWMHEHHGNGQPNAIISLNWDILPEKALSESKVGWRYSIHTPFLPVLKPHGSINWSKHVQEGLRAESADWQEINPGSPYSYIPRDPFFDPFEEGANQRLRHLLFPGDPEDEHGIAQIWNEAATAIEERQVVVFIGYSLPAYDAPARDFFQRVASRKQIEVYSRSSETLENYREVLGSITTDKPCSFEGSTYARTRRRLSN